MGTWAKSPTPRHQLVLISQTADDLVADDHPVRLLAAFLDENPPKGELVLVLA